MDLHQDIWGYATVHVIHPRAEATDSDLKSLGVTTTHAESSDQR